MNHLVFKGAPIFLISRACAEIVPKLTKSRVRPASSICDFQSFFLQMHSGNFNRLFCSMLERKKNQKYVASLLVD